MVLQMDNCLQPGCLDNHTILDEGSAARKVGWTSQVKQT